MSYSTINRLALGDVTTFRDVALTMAAPYHRGIQYLVEQAADREERELWHAQRVEQLDRELLMTRGVDPVSMTLSGFWDDEWDPRQLDAQQPIDVSAQLLRMMRS